VSDIEKIRNQVRDQVREEYRKKTCGLNSRFELNFERKNTKLSLSLIKNR